MWNFSAIHKFECFVMVEYDDALSKMAHFMLCCVLVSLSFHTHLESSVLFLLSHG